MRKRYLLVEGRDGHPVTDPHNPQANPARFAGWAPRTAADANPDAEHLLDHYRPERQVLEDHSDLRAAIKRGHLTLHAETSALSHDAARTAFAPPAASARSTTSKSAT
jgi:hypothetical protein